MTEENNSKPRQQLIDALFPPPPVIQPVTGPAVATSQNVISVLDCHWLSGPLGEMVECRVIMGPSQFAPGVPGQPVQGSIRFVANRQGAWYAPIQPFQQMSLEAGSPRLLSRVNVPHRQAFSLLWKPSTPGHPQGLQFGIHAERLQGGVVTHFANWTGPNISEFVGMAQAPDGRSLLFMRPNN